MEGFVSKKRTFTVEGSQGIGGGTLPGRTEAGGGDTWVVTFVVVDKERVGGRHGSRSEVRERVPNQQENLTGKSSEVGGSEEGRKTPGGTAREWEVESG